MDNIHEQEKGTLENFMFLFSKLFNESKYNLQSLNKRFESLEKCVNNVCILNTDEPFNENVNEDDEPMELTMADLEFIEKEFSPEKKIKSKKEKKENERLSLKIKEINSEVNYKLKFEEISQINEKLDIENKNLNNSNSNLNIPNDSGKRVYNYGFYLKNKLEKRRKKEEEKINMMSKQFL